MVTTSSITKRMNTLIKIINDAAYKYYLSVDEESLLTDAQYDKYLSELLTLEEKYNIRLKDSPTNKVGYEEVENRVKHFSPILSLKSTKSVGDLLRFLGDKDGILSWKLDGISIVLYYKHGNLIRALSRGDGAWGKDITKNVMLMRGVPKTITIKNDLIIRGEGCLSLSEFEQIKQTNEGERFSNPRNLAAGLINATKTSSILLRHMTFIVHSVVLIEGYGRNIKTRYYQFKYLRDLGFKIVPHCQVSNYTLQFAIEKMAIEIEHFEFPTDGLVLSFDDLAYSESLGVTSHHPKHSIALKWADMTVLTTVTGVKWSISNTGLITPVVTFNPVELEGTIIRQANLHNLKRFRDLKIGVGDTLKVYKANKIIPEVNDNLSRSGTEQYPEQCPKCGNETEIFKTELTEKLYCYKCKGRIE